MIDTPTILNTCYETTKDLRTIAAYSHLIPVLLSFALALFVFFKAKFNLFSKIFLVFVCTFSLWLIGDFSIWVSNDYHLVYAVWSTLDFIEIIFYILGLYFVLVFIYERDVTVWTKIGFLLLALFPFIITITGHSVTGFDQSVCEALNNDYLTNYKLIVEGSILAIILIHIVRVLFKTQKDFDKKADLIVLGSVLVFLITFGSTEYFSSVTGIYEVNLYSLFILPVFLVAIIYAVFELDIFHFNILGTHYLVAGLVIMIGGQLFFINNDTDKLLTILTIIIGIAISIILFRNLKRESDQRVRIERLSEELEISKRGLEESNKKLETMNDKLKELDKLKTEFLSLATHQLRSPLTAIKGYASMVVDGDFGEIGVKAKEAVDRILQSSNNLTLVIEDFLNVSKIESGGMKYVKENFDLSEMVSGMAKDLSITAGKKGLALSYTQDTGNHHIYGDKEKLRQVVLNFVDNSIKYTEKGSIVVSLTNTNGKVRIAIKDTGMGVTPEEKAQLFQKFSRADGAKLNAGGSGLGLYLAKEIIVAHNGNVGIESEGAGKGSTFFVELAAVQPTT